MSTRSDGPPDDGGDSGPEPVNWDEFWATDPEPMQYLVAPLIAAGEITRVYAQAKVGKSLLVQEAAVGLALGGKVCGQVVEPMTVVYCDQENTWDDWKPRLTDMGHGPDTDWSRLKWYSLQSWPPLDTATGGRCLIENVIRHGAKLVVLDTQSKFLEGEEDKAFTSAAFYRHTLLPLKRLSVACVIIDHAGNDPSKPRGSSGKRDDVDTVWQLTRRTKDQLTARRTHARKRHDIDTLYLHRVGNPLCHEVEAPDERIEQITDVCVSAIAGLDPIPPEGTSGNSVQKLLKKARESDGKTSFQRITVLAAWKRLHADLYGAGDDE